MSDREQIDVWTEEEYAGHFSSDGLDMRVLGYLAEENDPFRLDIDRARTVAMRAASALALAELQAEPD